MWRPKTCFTVEVGNLLLPFRPQGHCSTNKRLVPLGFVGATVLIPNISISSVMAGDLVASLPLVCRLGREHTTRGREIGRVECEL